MYVLGKLSDKNHGLRNAASFLPRSMPLHGTNTRMGNLLSFNMSDIAVATSFYLHSVYVDIKTVM